MSKSGTPPWRDKSNIQKQNRLSGAVFLFLTETLAKADKHLLLEIGILNDNNCSFTRMFLDKFSL